MSTGILNIISDEPVTLEEVKLRLRMTATADDALITSLIPSARAFAEKITGYSLVSKTYLYSLPRFPWPHEVIQIPVPPVSEVVSVTYLDPDGNPQPWPSTEYLVGLTQIPAVIRPRSGFIYPETLIAGGLDVVTVTFKAGPAANALGIDFTNIFEGIRQITVHYYNHPEAITNEHLEEMPLGIQSKLTPRYRPIH